MGAVEKIFKQKVAVGFEASVKVSEPITATEQNKFLFSVLEL